jgi:hypothetical protein
VAGEEPQVRADIEFGDQLALAERTAGFVDAGDAVEHQHRRRRQARIAGAEHDALGAFDQLLVVQGSGPRHGGTRGGKHASVPHRGVQWMTGS